ncbi:MAG: hypothetical protein II393_01985 [Cytophagales bacterium]|nr:hypothetical protein [Cytophagales bacterium]
MMKNKTLICALLFFSSFCSESKVAVGYSGLDIQFFRYLYKYCRYDYDKDPLDTKHWVKFMRHYKGFKKPTLYFHKICSYTGHPYLSRLLFCLLKFNFDIYIKRNHYITIKLFDFSYGQFITPWFAINNGKGTTNLFCIGSTIGLLEAGYGFIKKYKKHKKIYYSIEIATVLGQWDIVFRYVPFLYRFDNGMAIKIRLLNLSIINNICNLVFVNSYKIWKHVLKKREYDVSYYLKKKKKSINTGLYRNSRQGTIRKLF